MKQLFVGTLICLITAYSINAQIEMPRVSPKASVSQAVGYTMVTIDYSRPGVKGRTIWGGLVPYNQVWRTGANEATTIQFTTDISVEGNKVPAGIYSLFTIPSEREWTVILNKQNNIWGTNYNSEYDIIRFKVIPERSEHVEKLLFIINNLTDSSAVVSLNWENLSIAFKIETALTEQVYAKIKDAISKAKHDEWQVYVIGANYAAEHGVFVTEAFNWIENALTITKNFIIYLTKAKLYYKINKYTDALKALEQCREAGRNDTDYQNRIAEIDFLEKRIKSAAR